MIISRDNQNGEYIQNHNQTKLVYRGYRLSLGNLLIPVDTRLIYIPQRFSFRSCIR